MATSVKIDLPEPITLKLIFEQILEGQPIILDLHTIKCILRNDFSIMQEMLDVPLRYILPYMLVHYIKTWNMWQKRHCIDNLLGDWYKRFQEHIKFKLNHLIKHQYKVAVKDLMLTHDDVLFNLNEPSETQELISPATISIEGLPKILNTLVFCDDQDDLVKMKLHTEMDWAPLETAQLINYPYVQVVLRNVDFSITRTNVHDFQRYLSLSGNKLCVPKRTKIESATIINSVEERHRLAGNLMEYYFGQWISRIKELQNNVEILDDMTTIFREVLLDVQELNVDDSIATNTASTFCIGESTYVRNKKISSRFHSTSIVFTEYIVPKVELALHHFLALDVVDLEGRSEKFYQNNMPKVEYRCTFCDSEFMDSKDDMLRHLYDVHSLERPVFCFKCKNHFDVRSLTENRWRHVC